MFKKIFSLRLSLFFFAIVAICGIAFNVIGSSVDEQGFLQEPFALIPIGWLAFLLGLLTGGIYLIRRIVTIVANR